MKIGTKIFCINESVHCGHLSKGKEYVIQDLKDDQFRVLSDMEKLVWMPTSCFSFEQVPHIVSVHIDDQIIHPENACIEVTIEFSNGEKRWTTFVTPEHLNELLKTNHYLTLPKFVLVNKITGVIVEQVVHELDKQNELIEVSQTLTA